MDESDDALLDRSRRGDTAAFGVLVKRYAHRATGMAIFLVGARQDALDVSQEAFVRAWKYVKTYRGEADFFTWYSAILRKVCFTWLKRRGRRADLEPLETAAVEPEGSDAGANDPSAVAERRERAEQLWRAVHQLSPAHREIIMLCHFENLSYKQIAETLDIPLGTVMSRLHAARDALRTRLGGAQS